MLATSRKSPVCFEISVTLQETDHLITIKLKDSGFRKTGCKFVQENFFF